MGTLNLEENGEENVKIVKIVTLLQRFLVRLSLGLPLLFPTSVFLLQWRSLV